MEVECIREVLGEIKKSLPAHCMIYYSDQGFVVQIWKSVTQSTDYPDHYPSFSSAPYPFPPSPSLEVSCMVPFVSEPKDPFLTQLNKLLEHLKPKIDYKKFLLIKEIIRNKVEFKDALQCL